MKMTRTLLNPKVDFVFKKIFGSEDNKSVLMSFLNATLKPKEEIVSVELKNTDIEKEYVKDKFLRLDVKATTNKNETINIEIQLKDEHNMIQRTLYYWSKLYEEQIGEGDFYNKLNRTVCINILNFKYLKNDRFHNVYRLKEIETDEELTDIEEIHFIEIPKLREINLKEEKDMLKVWIEFLRDPESEVIRSVEMSNEEIRRAKDKLYKLSQDEKERELYFIREKSIKDEASALYNAEQKGIEKGIEQGMKEGLEQGGKKAKIDTIKKLNLMGLSIEQIAQGVSLTIDEVKQILENN